MPNTDEDSAELKRARFIRCGRLWTQNTEEEDGAFGFMLTAEELNGVFLRSNRIPIVIDDDVRPLLYICGFLLIKQAEWRWVGSHGVTRRPRSPPLYSSHHSVGMCGACDVQTHCQSVGVPSRVS